MKKIIFPLILSVLGLCLSAQDSIRIDYQAYSDSVFYADIAKEQISDSTLRDKIYYNLYQAQLCYHKNDFTNAMNHLSTCFDLTQYDKSFLKENATISYLFYEIYYAQKQFDKAYQFLQLAHIYNPKNTNYLRELAWFDFNIQSYDSAIKLLVELNKLLPYNSNNVYFLCQAYIKDGKFNKALKQLDIYENLEGHSVDILSARANLYQNAGKPQKALKVVEKYIKKYPEDYLEANFLLSQIYKVNKDTAYSLEIINNLNDIYPNNNAVLLSLADHYKEVGCDSLEEKYIFDAINTKNLINTTAVQVIRPIIASCVQSHDSIKLNAISDSLNNIYPNDVPIMELQSDIFRALEDTTNWIAELYKLRDLKFDENIDFQLISLLEQIGDNESVRKLTSDCYRKFKNDRWAYYKIISLSSLNNNDSIINVSKQLLPSITTPNIKSRVYQILGDLQYSINDSIAMAMYDSCLVYDPKNSGALNNVAYNLTKGDNPDLIRAEKLATTALEIEPESIYILDTYAWILFLRGDNFLSEFYFNKLLRIHEEKGESPTIETLYHIGCLYIKTNRLEEAKAIWEQAVDLFDQSPQALEHKDIFNSMKSFVNQ